MSIWNRVYMSVSLEFFEHFPTLSLMDIIDEFAKQKKYDENGKALVFNQDQVCRGRTKRHLLREVNRFIADIGYVDADIDMKTYVSGKQLKRLIKVFENKRGRITSYAMIIFHVLLLELRNSQPGFNSDTVLRLAIAVDEIAKMYYRQYPDDEIARFLVESGATLINEIRQNRVACKNEFPGIPRRGVLEEAG